MGVSLGRITKDDLASVACDMGSARPRIFMRLSALVVFPPVRCSKRLRPTNSHSGYARSFASCALTGPQPAGLFLGDGDLTIHVKGADDVLVYRAKCCTPVRGEQIVGYITRGKGVAVHSAQCPNVQKLMYEAERKIAVEWARSATEPLPVKIVIYTDDRPGVLHQLTSILSAESSNIRSLEARGDEKRTDDSASSKLP